MTLVYDERLKTPGIGEVFFFFPHIKQSKTVQNNNLGTVIWLHFRSTGKCNICIGFLVASDMPMRIFWRNYRNNYKGFIWEKNFLRIKYV